ncbi:uncharacterized protein LOC128229151 [Mya arenaria]|uniref:uncharacterized protein LOC128229151 n=1 Tax=Mya arenaria TaxID=6604 RepID=UPI0022E4CD01|nr:uncharacterized protein LOC128229151 [Mya arenaria]
MRLFKHIVTIVKRSLPWLVFSLAVVCVTLLFETKYTSNVYKDYTGGTEVGLQTRIRRFLKNMHSSIFSYKCQIVTKTRNNADLRIIVITYNRSNALMRLLESLNKADYGGSAVVLEVWIDRFNSEQYSIQTVDILSKFYFDAGFCDIHLHPTHVGLTGQWLHTWKPKDKEIAVILEDDLTVSPYFYKYLRLMFDLYGNRSDVSGFTLQGQSIKHDPSAGGQLDIDPKHKVFLYPTLGTSGFAPNFRQWKPFKEWLAECLTLGTKVPLVPKHKSSIWYQQFEVSGRTDTMWEMEYLYYTWKHNQYTLYPNFKDHKGLAFNWFEDGLHSTGERRGSGEDKRQLVMNWTLVAAALPRIPAYVNNAGQVIRDEVS